MIRKGRVPWRRAMRLVRPGLSASCLVWSHSEDQFPPVSYLDRIFAMKSLADTKGKFGPDLLADFVADYIQQHQTEPFFLYYSLVLPHDPWIEPPGYQRSGAETRRFPSEILAREGAGNRPGGAPGTQEAEEKQRRFAAMVAYVDKMVGRVTA
jgi:arylsulfatase A